MIPSFFFSVAVPRSFLQCHEESSGAHEDVHRWLQLCRTILFIVTAHNVSLETLQDARLRGVQSVKVPCNAQEEERT